MSEDGGGQGWRHLGFGRFLLIHVIKRCMCHLEIQNQASPGAEPFDSGHVRLFLQSTNAQALMFYTSNGFIVLSDDKDNDGYDKLQKCIRAELPRIGDETSFIGFDPEDKLPASKLLFLPPNNLHKTNDHILDLSDDIENIIPPSQDDPTSVPAVLDLTSSPAKVNPRESQANLQLSSWWCEYLFRSKGDLRNLSYRSSDFLSLMKNLHVLRHLLPTDPILPLLPSESMRIHGLCVMDRRMKLFEKDTAWFGGDELDLFFAILQRDSRFADAYIVPISYKPFIVDAYEHYVKLEKLTQLKQEWLSEGHDEAAISDKILSKFGKMEVNILDEYSTLLNKVIKCILHPNPSLIHKKIIVIPNNQNESHWTATFVFNAASVVDGNVPPYKNSPACWYHFDPCGRWLKISVEHSGMEWFLNLAFSYYQRSQDYQAEHDGPTLTWLNFFPMQREGDQMVASPTFPSVTFDDKDLDKYSWNCGMGICAATSLILQEFLLVLTSKNEYHHFLLIHLMDSVTSFQNAAFLYFEIMSTLVISIFSK